jgi:hypothetical protein
MPVNAPVCDVVGCSDGAVNFNCSFCRMCAHAIIDSHLVPYLNAKELAMPTAKEAFTACSLRWLEAAKGSVDAVSGAPYPYQALMAHSYDHCPVIDRFLSLGGTRIPRSGIKVPPRVHKYASP